MLALLVPKKLHPLPAYLLALAAVVFSLMIRYPLQPILGSSAPDSTFYLAVFVIGWVGGFWPGMIATLASAMVAQIFLIEPLYGSRSGTLHGLAGTITFLITGGLMSFLCEALRTATESSIVSAERASASARDAQIARDHERNILESISDGFIAFDHAWRISFINERAAGLLGLRRSDLLGTHIVSLYPNILLSESYPKLRGAVEKNEAIQFEFYEETHDRWFGNTVYPSASGAAMFIREITQSRKLADAVRESEERFRIIADSAPLVIWTTNGAGQRDYVNRLFFQFSGKSVEEDADAIWMELVHPDDQARVRIIYETSTEAQVSFSAEYRMLSHSGRYCWMLDSGAPRFSPRGDFLGSVGSCLDITDRRRAEEALRESEAQLRLSMSVSQMGTWHVDYERDELFLSPELESILGLHSGGYARTRELAASLIHPDDRQHMAEVVGPVFARGGEYETECRVVRPDGSIRWLLLRGQGFTKAAGVCTLLTGVGIDVTERKELEERVRDAQKLESLGVLAGGIAHDFNNLLTGIMGGASMVLEDLEPGSNAWFLQQNVMDASERAARLTGQMLAYSGKGRFFVERVNIGKLVRDNLELIRTSFHSNRIDLQIDLCDSDCVVEADPIQMQQVLMNLVVNAAEAVPAEQSGAIRIATEISKASEEWPELDSGEFIVLEIADTGMGMSEQTLTRVFEPFFTTKFTGRGLGLAAVQGIVRGHRGAIHVTSTLGMGTKFQVCLPCAQPSVPKVSEPAPARWQESGTILFVDDEELIRSTATAALQRFGYEVVTAKNGQHAIELFEKRPEAFAVVILDMTMPVMNGEEALPLLRACRPDIIVIVCSGFSEAEAQERFGRRSIDFFLQKPYNAAHLAEKVRQATRRAVQ